ncbi:MAG: hypothetical protein NVV82_08465 [Sporocytophaga sp.]|nr:hypothetical protein [Sporocytophaga sp.]
MKILVALSRFPFPIDKGDKLRAFYQIQGLSKYHEVHLVCIADKTPSPAEFNEVKQYCKSIEVIKVGKLKRFINLGFGLFNNLPFQVNYFKSSRMKRVIGKVLKAHSIDMCYVQLVRLVGNIPFSLTTKYYLDYMDALSEGMHKRVKLSKWYEKPLVKLEAKRLRDFEAKAFFSSMDIQSLQSQMLLHSLLILKKDWILFQMVFPVDFLTSGLSLKIRAMTLFLRGIWGIILIYKHQSIWSIGLCPY